MKRIACLLIVLFTALGAYAQSKPVVADKIIAIVGDRIILKSDIFNQIADIQRQGGQVPENADCFLIEQTLIGKVLAVQAEKDSLVIGEEEIEAELDQRIRYFISQFGNKEELERVAGKSVYQIKDDSRQSVRERKLAETMQKKIVENVKITPNEVKAYFDKIPKDSLPFYESELEVGEIVQFPKASREIEKLTIDELKEYKTQVETGARKFETLAALYSEDPGTKENGGVFEMSRNDKNVDGAFKSAAFRLKEGQVSPVVKSQFGYHIIQLSSRAGDDIVVRHILRRPVVTDAEIATAVTALDSVRLNILSGKIDFGEAVAKHSNDDMAKFTAGMKSARDGSTYITIDQLDKDIVVMLKNLKVGDITKPTSFTDERGRKGVRIVYLKTRTEPHRENLKDDYSRIAQRALEEKKIEVLDKWFAGKIPTYYIMIDDDFKNCSQIEKWVAGSKKKPF
jgi:peptidyl-prolyl cis-trans isomerase SurA